MSEIGPINAPHAALGGYASKVNGKSGPVNTAQRLGDDQVEVSATARLLSQIGNAEPAEVDVVGTARQLIDSGFYDQPEVIDATVERLIAAV